jgi:hypothetical protein
MIILAIYYTIADIVLLAQCFYYRGFTLRDHVSPPPPPAAPTPASKAKRSGNLVGPTERTALLTGGGGGDDAARPEPPPYWAVEDHERRDSWTHLSPAVPFVNEEPVPAPQPAPTPWPQAVALNGLAILMVCAAGIAGWWLSKTYGRGGGGSEGPKPGAGQDHLLKINALGQVFGWLCAVLYLGSRLPQLLLNWRRKSTEGVSVLFFLFACLGNLTFVLSIMAFDPKCASDDGCRRGEAARIYWQYVLVNLSWLAGSAGTLLLDMAIFVQFFLYSKVDEAEESSSSSSDEGSSDEEETIGGEGRNAGD